MHYSIYEVNKNTGKRVVKGVNIQTDSVKEAGFLFKVTLRTMKSGGNPLILKIIKTKEDKA